jgi:hypothetical protein
MFSLYLKTHTETGLKYLGFTKNDPYTYLGSGKYWLAHIKKHGVNIKTEILFQSECKSDIKAKGQYYSNLWNIVESNEFANLTIEEATGGAIFKGRKHKPESIQKMKDSKKGVVFSTEHRLKLSESHKGNRIGKDNHFFGKQHTADSKAKMSEALTGKVRTDEFKNNLSKLYKGIPKKKLVCPFCNKEGGEPQMKRYHFNNCKRRTNMS